MTTTTPHETLTSFDPATGRATWSGPIADAGAVTDAVQAAREAWPRWRAKPLEARIKVAERFAEIAAQREGDLAASISRETGKPMWEATGEAKLVPAKVKLAIEALHERTGDSEVGLPQGRGRVCYQPLGVVAVLGPFNFPAHLPNGHLVPALLAGNTGVFKPSEQTPGTGELLASLWSDAGLPEGVLRVVQGGRETGAALIDAEVDGVFFTGSSAGGRAIHRALAGRTEVLLALEMGGNNPIIVHEAADLETAAYLVAVSAFITAGQRCTCARRLVLPEGVAIDPLLEKLIKLTNRIVVGYPSDEPEPFMGPVISTQAGRRVLEAQQDLVDGGATPLLRCETLRGNDALISPGVLDVTGVQYRGDEEVFGPMLQVVRVPDFDAALDEANQTGYGLATSLISDDAALYERFAETVRAGVVNWNQPTTGASGRLPFGGLGASGNHRPSGYHAADYCADATARLESATLVAPSKPLPGISISSARPNP